MAKKRDFTNGVWRTVGGRRIFIEDGDDLATAMRKSGKFRNKKSPVVENAPDEIIDYLYEETGRDTVSKTEIDDYINNDFLDDELSDYEPTKEEYEAVYKEIQKRGYKVYDEEARNKQRKSFTKTAKEINRKTKESAKEAEKATDKNKRYNTNKDEEKAYFDGDNWHDLAYEKEQYEDQLSWYEEMEKRYPTAKGLAKNEEYQELKKEYEKKFGKRKK